MATGRFGAGAANLERASQLGAVQGERRDAGGNGVIVHDGRKIAGALVLSAAGAVVSAGGVSAHTAQAVASCVGLQIDVTDYPDGVTTTFVIDGVTHSRPDNGSWTIAWDSSRDHTWTVTVDGADGDEFDRQFGDHEQACITSTTEPATTAPSPAAPTTATPETTTAPLLLESTTTMEAPSAVASTSTTVIAVANGSSGGSGSTRTERAVTARADGGAQELPATGYGTSVIAAIAAMTLGGGAALLLLARRRTS